jgi:hypothetical protein
MIPQSLFREAEHPTAMFLEISQHQIRAQQCYLRTIFATRVRSCVPGALCYNIKFIFSRS